MTDMSLKIGSAAGEIWQYLSMNEKATPIDIKASLCISNTILYLALGWLSREDKVNIVQDEHSYIISLK
jgi:hypothetical protein